MARRTYRYDPDYAVPPGLILAEHIEARGFSREEFARRCGQPLELISALISGQARLEPAMAQKFEALLGLDKNIWMRIEEKYQLRKTAKAHRK